MSQVPVTLDDVRAIVGPPPEPEEGVVDRVVDSDDWAWQRGHDGWHRVREEDGSWVDVAYTWEQMDATYGPVRALR